MPPKIYKPGETPVRKPVPIRNQFQQIIPPNLQNTQLKKPTSISQPQIIIPNLPNTQSIKPISITQPQHIIIPNSTPLSNNHINIENLPNTKKMKLNKIIQLYMF